MLTLKLLFVLIGSCIAYSTSGFNSYKLTSEPLSPFEDKEEKRVAPQDVLRSNVADSDDLQLFNKHKRAVLKSILNGILLKERMGTKGRLVKGASGIHSSHLRVPEINTASANVLSHDDNHNRVSKTKQPGLCSSPSHFDKNIVNSNVHTELLSSENEATIKPCLAYGPSFTNNRNRLHSIIQKKFQHIPLSSTSTFELPSAHLNPYVNIQNYNTLHSDPLINTNTPDKVSTDIPESHSFILLNTPKYSADSVMQQNFPQVKKCDLVNSESSSLNNLETPEEINQPSNIIIPEPPAYFPLNSPEVFVGPIYSNNVQNVHLDSDVQNYDDSHIHDSFLDNLLIGQDISKDFTDNSDLSNSLPCLQTPHEEPIENTPISIPEAPALLPLNPPSISFTPIDTTFNDVVNKDITSIDSANLELSDSIPCPQSSTQSVVIADDVLSDISETPTLPSHPTSSNVEIPDPPAYIPLNPPIDSHSSPVNGLTAEDISNIESDNSESSDPSCSQNTVESKENFPYIIPEPPALLPLNPPDVSLYPTYFNDEGHKEEPAFDLANVDLSEFVYYPPSFTPPTEDNIPAIILETVAPTLGHCNDNAIIPDPPAYIPLNPEGAYIGVPEDKNINYDIPNDSKIPCQQSLVVESTENTPIIYNEEITNEPFVPENPLSFSNAIIPDPPSYIPLITPDTTFNVAIDKDTYISSTDNHEHVPCSQPHFPVTELSDNLPLDVTEYTKPIVIPNPPSYIPLNSPQVENANKAQKEIPSVVSNKQESEGRPCYQTTNTETIQKLSVASLSEEFDSFSSNEQNPASKPELIVQSPDGSNSNVLYVCSDDSEGSTYIPCQHSSRIESLQSTPVSLPEAPINSPIHLSFSIKQQISLPNLLHDSNVLPLETGKDYRAQKSTVDTSSSNEPFTEDTGSEYAEQQVTNNFKPTIAITDRQIQGSVSPVVTTLLNNEANSKIPELPPCASDIPVDGITTDFFESKKCKSNKQESTLTFKKFSQPAQHLRERKVWIKKSLTPGAESSQPLRIKKTKKFRILRNQN